MKTETLVMPLNPSGKLPDEEMIKTGVNATKFFTFVIYENSK